MNASSPITLEMLNQDQQHAARGIFQFLLSNDREFSISGPAGTGKTFLMHFIMKQVLREYEDACALLGETPIDWEIFLTATTHKAADVLQVSTGFPTMTIHSCLNIKVNENFKTGKTTLVRNQTWGVLSRKLIFIDEASMVDSELYKMIQDTTDDSCKIIYLGDHCQLAPVNEKISKVYQIPTKKAELTIPMRNADQPILGALCDQLRETVETGIFKPIMEHPGIVTYVNGPQAANFIDLTFQTENNDAQILCYTNQRVHAYAEHIRDLRGYPAHFVAPERVILNNTLTLGKTQIRTETELQILSVSAPFNYQIPDTQDHLCVRDVSVQTLNGSVIPLMVAENQDAVRALKRTLAAQKHWPAYYHIKNTLADLRPRDASTVYKAQGSTVDTVFLDIGNIGISHDAEQVARMLYVGVSRARSKVLLFGDLPGRYVQTPVDHHQVAMGSAS